MVKEYAVDPSIAAQFSLLNLISLLFDYSNPRRISRFPKKWERIVCEEAIKIGDQNHSRVVEKLKQMKESKNCLVSLARNYDPSVGWINNIQTANATRPFAAVITEEVGENYISSNQLDEFHQLLECKTDFIIARNDDSALLKVLTNCLQQAREIIFIDPYINFYTDPSARRYKQAFTKIFKCISDRTNSISFTITLCLTGENFSDKTADDIKGDIQSFSGLSDDQISIILLPKDIAHNRYILTDIASFSMGDSIWYDRDQTREDHIAMMSYESYMHHRNRYIPS